ncbi:MAG TPA: DNA adenine methylase [Gemmataceae bacterium]
MKWHGGKHYLARRIVALMPQHTHYVETHGGGLAVLLAKPCEGISEVVNDLNGDLVTFWRCLQDPIAFGVMQRMLSTVPFARKEWEEAEARHSNAAVGRAIAFFIRVRQSLAGRGASFQPLSKTRTRRGMNEQVSAWLTAIEGLPAVHARLRRVVIENIDALELIRREDGPQSLFYADPVYLQSTRTARSAYGQYEMCEQDHQNLLDTLAGIKGRFLLSGYRSELYDAVAEQHGWRRVDFDLPNNAASGKSKRRMIECVWMNY